MRGVPTAGVDMIVEYVRYRVADDRRAASLADYARAADVLARARQYVDHELSRSADEPACRVLLAWTSAADHLEGFRGGELFPAFLDAVRPYVGVIEEMRDYEPTPVRGAGDAVPTLHDWAGGTPRPGQPAARTAVEPMDVLQAAARMGAGTSRSRPTASEGE
jgi:hypothetical protein